jgi:thioredoxin reductase (NADPH)
MYRGKSVAVVGGGNTAATEALFLANLASKVFLIHRRDTLRADEFIQKKIFDNGNIEMAWDSEVLKITGSRSVDGIEVKHLKSASVTRLSVSGVFIAVGTEPVSEFVKGVVDLDEQGYIIAEDTITSQQGIFAAGDVVSGSLKQAVFAAGQGALAAQKIEDYLRLR